MTDRPDILSGMQRALRQLDVRQRVIAGNLANSDTPGFKALDVKSDFANMVDQRVGKADNPTVALTARMSELGAKSGNSLGVRSDVIVDNSATEIKPDGNSVNIEEQMMKMSQIQTEYITLINLYKKNISLFKSAIGK
ncbi:flagellar basal body rod protein FlgB [Sphingorhabdus sp. EL138]|jgi:flagellar basal-body rod protein FlgB|uniref:flagellar basal body rod protein FlgB n=1 Tax=Sphingorhabdus sp. EL138 TaxID=2073156 RepID=UPI0025DC8A57|nr:flagellar basal body rod protein FlgB [Sphingorhabdus sp. EL138]